MSLTELCDWYERETVAYKTRIADLEHAITENRKSIVSLTLQLESARGWGEGEQVRADLATADARHYKEEYDRAIANVQAYLDQRDRLAAIVAAVKAIPRECCGAISMIHGHQLDRALDVGKVPTCEFGCIKPHMSYPHGFGKCVERRRLRRKGD